MKNKLIKLLIGLGLVLPVLAGCGQKRETTPKDDETTEPSGDNNGGENTNPGGDTTPLPDSSGIPTYEGNTARQVGKINNVPVTAYKAETLARIRYVAKITGGGGSDNEEVYNTFVEYMLDLGVGDELALAFCDFMEHTYHLSMEGFNAMNASVLGENGANFIDVCYEGLTLINSYDLLKLENLFNKLNKANKDSAQKRYDEANIAEYYSVNINGLSYYRYKQLKEIGSKINNAELNAMLTKYEAALDKYYYTPEQIQNFNEYKQNLKENLDNAGIIPEGIVNFVKAHANDAKDILVKDLKLIVDAFGACAPDILNAVKKNSRGNFYYYTTVSDNYGNTYTNNVYYHLDNNAMAREIVNSLLKNKETVLGLLKAIVVDQDLGNLLLDAVNEVVLPEMEKAFKDNSEMSPKVAQFKTRINALNGKHVSALTSFVLKVINQISKEDIVDFILLMTGNNNEFNIIEFGNKYIGKLDEVIAAVTAQEKQLILEMSQIFGLDILVELSKFSAIYQGKDLETEAGMQKFQEDMGKWAQELYKKAYDNFFCFFGGSAQGGASKPYPDEPTTPENVYIDVHIMNGVYMNEQVNANDVYISYHNGNEEVDVYGTPDQINEQAAEYQQRLDEMSAEEKAEWPEEVERLQKQAALTISGVVITADTSHCGNVPCTVSFVLAGKSYTVSTYLNVMVKNMPYYREAYINYNNTLNVYSNSHDISVVEKGAEATLYDKENGGSKVDTSTSGWHFVTYNSNYEYDDTEYTSYVLYYVTTIAELEPYIVRTESRIGTILSNGTSFSNGASKQFEYDINGVEFHRYQYLSFSQDLVSGKAVNKKYTVTKNGVEYEYVIIDASKPVFTSYEFRLNENLSGETISTPTTKTMEARVNNRYVVTIDGVIYTYYDSGKAQSVTVNDFTFINDVVRFTYLGVSYEFIRD